MLLIYILKRNSRNRERRSSVVRMEEWRLSLQMSWPILLLKYRIDFFIISSICGMSIADHMISRNSKKLYGERKSKVRPCFDLQAMVVIISQNKKCNLESIKNQRNLRRKGSHSNSIIRKLEWNMKSGLSLQEEVMETRLVDIRISLVQE